MGGPDESIHPARPRVRPKAGQHAVGQGHRVPSGFTCHPGRGAGLHAPYEVLQLEGQLIRLVAIEMLHLEMTAEQLVFQQSTRSRIQPARIEPVFADMVRRLNERE